MTERYHSLRKPEADTNPHWRCRGTGLIPAGWVTWTCKGCGGTGVGK